MILERLCRAGAVAIALAAVIDPAWMSARAVRPVVHLYADGGIGADDVARVRGALGQTFEVVPQPTPSTAAHVVVGHRPPETWPDGVTFVVTPALGAAPTVRSIVVPEVVALGATATVSVRTAVPPSSEARMLAVTLRADGVAVETRAVSIPAGADEATADLSFAPARAGLARLQVAARLGDGPESYADAVTAVHARTLRVLVFEAQPSWGATFVRRALEDDPRFDVVVRSVTSRNVSVGVGAAPATLDRAESLEEFDAVLVATPEALGDREGAALESYLRRREGAVVLLPSENGGRVIGRLTGVDDWVLERRPGLEAVAAAAHRWTASEFLWPSRWPLGAEPLTSCVIPDRRCAVWRVPVGGGRVVVSSALDGWRTRGAEASTFGPFWRALVADEAGATPRPIEVVVRSRMVEPGAIVSADVAVLEPTRVPQAEWQNTTGSTEPVRLWPSGDGRYRAAFHAPRVPGRYRLNVTAASLRAAEEFLVVDVTDMKFPIPERDALLEAFASSRGGAVVPMAELETLSGRMTTAVTAPPVETPVHPMRSPFWIVPFAGLLAAEWWSRRRRGAR